MNVLTSRMDSNPMKKCQSKTRWHSLLTSSLVQDYGCSVPPVTPAVKQAAQTSVPASVFSSAAADFSLGVDGLKTISSDTSWPSPDAASWNLASYSTAAWMEVGGDWGLPRTAWMSLMSQPGTILMNSTKPYCPVVVASASKWGCVVWPVQGQVHGGRRWVSFTKASASTPRPWSFKVISDILAPSIKAYPVTVSRPSTPLRSASGDWVGCGAPFTVEDAQGGLKLSVLAAKRAFLPLTMQHMAGLVDSMGVPLPFPRPVNEKAWTSLLVNHFLPSLAQAERDKIIAKRGNRQYKQHGTVLDKAGNMDVVEGIVDESDMPKFAAVSKAKQLASAKSASKPGGAPSSSATGQTPQVQVAQAFVPIPGVMSCTPGWAKGYIPKVPGCSISLDGRRYNRWSVQYKGKLDPPFHHTKAYGNEATVSRRAALIQCLKWVWAVHADMTGQPCLWLLE